jgi:hypothetical protein
MTNWKLRLVGAMPERLQVAAWTMRAYRRKFGRWPNLFFPSTFNEIIQARKVWQRDDRLPLFADKHRVKAFVQAKLGSDWIIPTLWAGPTFPAPSERRWPKPFVIKMNNACHRNIFVRSEVECDWAAIESRCETWLTSPYGIDLGEWFYRRIPPMIMVEPFIGSSGQLPLDFKFWTFHGRVEFIHVVTGREGEERQAFFDRHWNRINVDQGFPVETREIAPPASLDVMIEAAECLAADTDFVRVDLYEVGGRPLFGEITLYPGAGFNRITPPAFDRHLVALWQGKRVAGLGTGQVPAEKQDPVLLDQA